MTNTQYFNRFFEEKDLPIVAWDFEINGIYHAINSDVVIEAIKNTCGDEALKVRTHLRKLDFANADILKYLQFLAYAMAATNTELRGQGI